MIDMTSSFQRKFELARMYPTVRVPAMTTAQNPSLGFPSIWEGAVITTMPTVQSVLLNLAGGEVGSLILSTSYDPQRPPKLSLKWGQLGKSN